MKSSFIFVAAVSLVLSACAPSSSGVAEAVQTSLAEAVTLTALAPTETAVPTEVPPSPTPEPPSPTPAPPVISPGNMTQLTLQMRFGHVEAIRSMAFSPDGTILVSAGGNTQDFDIRIWDAGTGILLRSLVGHTGIVWKVAISPDGRLLASASNDNTVKIWDLATGDLLQTLGFPYAPISVRFSPDNQSLAIGGGTGNADATVWIYSVDPWKETMKLSQFWNIPDLEYTPNGQYLVGGGTSRNVSVWRTSDGAEEHVLNHAGQVSNLAISPDGSTIATSLCAESTATLQCIHGAVWLWDLGTGTVVKKLTDFTDWATDVAYSPDGALLFAGARNGRMILYDAASYQFVPYSVADGMDALAVSPDGRVLATAGSGGIDLWSVGP